MNFDTTNISQRSCVTLKMAFELVVKVTEQF